MTDKPKSTFARRVRAARPRARKYEISDDAILGLTLRVFPSGARTFSLSRRVRGRRRQPHDRARGAQAHRQLHRASEKGQRPHDPGATDGRLRRRVPRTPGPPLEAPHAGVQHLHGAQVHPAYLRTHDRGRYRRRTRQGLVRLHGRPARCRQPFHAGPVRHDAHGRALGIPPHNSNPCKRTRRYRMKPKERFLTADEMARLNAVLAPRRVLLPAHRRDHPPADAHRVPPRRSRLPRMGLDSRHAHPPARLGSPGRARSGCRAPRARSSTPSRGTAQIAPSCFPPVPRRATLPISSTNGTASATRRVCPACGFMTFAIAGPRPPP